MNNNENDDFFRRQVEAACSEIEHKHTEQYQADKAKAFAVANKTVGLYHPMLFELLQKVPWWARPFIRWTSLSQKAWRAAAEVSWYQVEVMHQTGQLLDQQFPCDCEECVRRREELG